jgi:hypothetical protein
MCINRTPANVQKRLAAWSNHGPIPRDSGTGGTIEQWQSQPSARARSALAASSRRSQRELRASPAVSPALSRRKGGAGKRRRRAARARDRERGSGAARRAAAAHRVRARPLRSPLAFARSQPRRGSLRGRGAACACAAAGGRLAAAAPWRGRGDIDSVAIAPTGVAVAIETKTRTYDGRHLVRVREQVAWLSRRRRRWACNGALGVVCMVRARGVERVEHGVLVVSVDRLACPSRRCSDGSGHRVRHLPRAHTAGFARQSGSVTTSAREFRSRSKGAATQALAPTPPYGV